MSPITARVNRLLIELVAIVLLVMIFVVVAGRVTQIDGARDQCRASSKGAGVVAPALRAQANYLTKVLKAKSVKQDVKMAARGTQQVMSVAADTLTSLAGSNRNCSKIYPYIPHL